MSKTLADFRYLPTTGPLSGPSFVSQTEQTFNELGNSIGDTLNAVGNAREVASNAQTTALDAQQTALAALSEAQTAKLTAGVAKDSSAVAQQTAEVAQSTADAALNSAATANTNAMMASQNAEKAQTAAETAQTTADEALDAADSASLTAGNALRAAAGANGIFHVISEPDDADDYSDPAKVYFEGVASTTNLPAGHEDKGGFLKVYVAQKKDEAGSAAVKALQTFYSPSGSVFRREGASSRVEDEEGTEEIVTWGEWTETSQGVFTVRSGSWNADLQSGTPDMTYLDAEAEAAGLPLGTPAFIRTTPTGTRNAVLQTCHAHDGSESHIRTGTVTDGSVVWEAWHPLGGSSSPETASSYQVAATAPADTARLWIRSSDRTAYFYDDGRWQPIVGVYAETTAP